MPKYIKIIFFLFFKNYFWDQRTKTIKYIYKKLFFLETQVNRIFKQYPHQLWIFLKKLSHIIFNFFFFWNTLFKNKFKHWLVSFFLIELFLPWCLSTFCMDVVEELFILTSFSSPWHHFCFFFFFFFKKKIYYYSKQGTSIFLEIDVPWDVGSLWKNLFQEKDG
jgi:hypothetical protein